MNALPDLRHLVFLSDDLDSTVSQAQRELGLVSGVRNTEDLAEQGYHHEVLTIGRTFLEFTAPVSVDSEPAKLLADRGVAGLAVIVQVSDIEITKKRALDLGIRPEGEELYQGHSLTQWGAQDFGILTELVEVRPQSSWFWAPDVFEHGSTDVVQDFVAIDLAVTGAELVAQRWAHVLGLPLGNDRCVLDVSSREIRFVESAGQEGLLAVELPATERTMAGRVTTLSGVEFRLV